MVEYRTRVTYWSIDNHVDLDWENTFSEACGSSRGLKMQYIGYVMPIMFLVASISLI